MSLECRVVQAPPPPHVYLTGAIDEHTDLDRVFAHLYELRADPLILNLEGVIRINSISALSWRHELAVRGAELSLLRLALPAGI